MELPPGKMLRSLIPRRVATAGAAVGSLFALSGCGSIIISSGPGPSTTVVPVPSVHIGLLVPLTGPQAATGQAVKDGAKLAVSQYDGNSSSKVHAVLDIENATGAPARAAGALIAKGDVAVVGPVTDTEAAAADPVFAHAGVPQVVVASAADQLSEGGDVDFHRLNANDSEVGQAEAKWLIGQGAGTVQVVAAGRAYSTLLNQLTGALSDQLGSQPPTYTYPAPGTNALDAALDITSEDPEPDAVVFVGQPANAGDLATDLRDLGFSGTILLAGSAGDPGLAATQSWVADAPDGTANLACACDNPGSTAGAAPTFVTAYTAAYGVPPPEWSAQAYDATNAVLTSLTASPPPSSTSSAGSGSPGSGSAGSGTAATTTTTAPGTVPTKAAVAAALDAYSANGVSGPISFDATTGELTSPAVWISSITAGHAVQQNSVSATIPGGSD